MKQIKSKKRVSTYGEVFTNEREVNAMLNLIPEISITTTFLEPACGNGNFVIEILNRKLDLVHANSSTNKEYIINLLRAVSSIYAVDIQNDNILECKTRMIKMIQSQVSNHIYEQTIGAIEVILNHNILCGNTLEVLSINHSPLIFSEWSINYDGTMFRKGQLYSDMLNGITEYIDEEFYHLTDLICPLSA